MQIVLAGSSGFLGTHLASHLTERGHDVVRLVRREATSPQESSWDPYAGRVDADVVASADVVVNLAGSPTMGNPHSKTWARELRRSRVTTTALLARTIAATGGRATYLAGSGISWYGDHGDAPCPETVTDSRGEALLTSVCRDWEAAADPAREVGARVVHLRTAPVLDKESAPLNALRPLFRLGLGARLGSGRQRFPVISLRDWVRGVTWAAEHDTVAGPINLCTPTTPTNKEFTDALASALSRPAFLVAPRAVLSPLAGAMAPEILGSLNAVPQALLDDGFAFRDPDVTAAIAAGLDALRP